MTATNEGLQKLRAPFADNQISHLPKGGVKLAYVGHAALTDRLLSVDPLWTWEPVAYDPRGLPMIDEHGGLWIKLTVCGVTRLGYGDAGAKKGGDAVKERIGDALRNAAMRFGAALDLWHKGELHTPEPEPASVITGEQVSQIATLVNETNTDAQALLQWISDKAKQSIGNFSQIPANAYPAIIAQLEKKKVAA